jgi:hypothetical protein
MGQAGTRVAVEMRGVLEATWVGAILWMVGMGWGWDGG